MSGKAPIAPAPRRRPPHVAWYCNLHVLNLIAFLSLIIAIVILALLKKGDAAIMTGLIGVLGTFKPWSIQVPSAEPQPTRIVNDSSDPAITREVK